MFNETFKTASIFLKVSLIPGLLGFIFHLVAFSSSNWHVEETFSDSLTSGPSSLSTYCGLWNCGECSYYEYGKATCYNVLIRVTDELLVTRVFVMVSLFTSCAVLSLTLLCLFISDVARRDMSHIATCLISISTAGFVLIGVVVFGTSNPEPRFQQRQSLGWSYGFCIAAFVMYFLNTVLLFFNVLKLKS